jgi:hypothetical protein
MQITGWTHGFCYGDHVRWWDFLAPFASFLPLPPIPDTESRAAELRPDITQGPATILNEGASEIYFLRVRRS